MSDQRLRDLERRWKETGTVVDEAAYLLERVRVGDLSRERLELAAYCGHEGARAVTGVEPASTAPEVFAYGLARFGTSTMLLAGLAVARHAQDIFKRVSHDDAEKAAYESLLVTLWQHALGSVSLEQVMAMRDEYRQIAWHPSGLCLIALGDLAETRHWRDLVRSIKNSGFKDAVKAASEALSSIPITAGGHSEGNRSWTPAG